jgi:uncharacterized protein (DUF433 family)
VTRKRSDLPIVLVPHPHVRVDPEVLGGSPYVVGTRVPVRRLWGFYRNGATVDVLLKRYPQLGPGKVFDALAFAFDNPEVMEADLLRESRLLHGPDSERTAGAVRGAKAATQMELPFGSRQT